MRFNVQECDAVELCREVKMMVNMQTKMVNAYFHTDLEILPIQADSRWFLKVLSSLLCVPKLYTGIPQNYCHRKSTLPYMERRTGATHPA